MTKKIKYGYGAVGLTDGAATSFIGSYLLFFLTTIAGLNPAIAGTISGAATVISSIWSPIVGFLSDRTVSKHGRRRKFILIALVPLTASVILAFCNLDMANQFKAIYYCIVICVFWCSFSTFYGPWLALGAEITTEYNERTELRSFAMITNLLGGIFGMTAPPILVDIMTENGISESKAWLYMAVIVAGIILTGMSITLLSTRKKDTGSPLMTTGKITDLFREYCQVLKLKPILFVIGMCLCQITSQTIFMADRLYFFTFNLNLTAGQISVATIAFNIASAIAIYPILKLSNRFDKRIALSILMIFSASSSIILDRVIGITDVTTAIIFTAVFAFANVAFWQLVPAMLYDICEYDNRVNGIKREGIIVSVQSVMETVCNGLGMFLLGTILQFMGFDGNADTQSSSALLGIDLSLAVIPAALMIVCAILSYKFPISKAVLEKLRTNSADQNY